MTDRVIGTVGQSTRAAEVISNLRRSGKGERVDDLKVKGRKLQDGSIELYWSTKRSSLWDRLSGRAAERRALARQAFEFLCKTEMHHLEKKQCFIHAYHRDAVSVLLNSAGFDREPGDVYKVNKHANRHALKSFRLHAQLMELEGLCREIRGERDRYAGAVAFCDSLAKVKETKDGRPVLNGLTYQRKLGEGGYGELHVYCDKEGREYAVKVIRPRDDADTAQEKLDFMHECDALAAAGKSGAREIVKLVREPLRIHGQVRPGDGVRPPKGIFTISSKL
jgi:hypothetical protein